MYNMYNKNF